MSEEGQFLMQDLVTKLSNVWTCYYKAMTVKMGDGRNGKFVNLKTPRDLYSSKLSSTSKTTNRFILGDLHHFEYVFIY